MRSVGRVRELAQPTGDRRWHEGAVSREGVVEALKQRGTRFAEEDQFVLKALGDRLPSLFRERGHAVEAAEDQLADGFGEDGPFGTGVEHETGWDCFGHGMLLGKRGAAHRVRNKPDLVKRSLPPYNARIMKASDLLVNCLENEGVKYVFALPGEENLDLLESLRASGIRVVVCRHEQAAGFMAATLGRLTGKTGVCLSTLGPGATNFVTAAAFAQLGGMPMLMITGQKPIRKSKQGQFQILRTNEILEPVTKFSRQIVSGTAIPALVREAFRVAEEERPGAVHLELPEDVAAEETDGKAMTVTTVRRPVAEEKAIARAVEMIRSSRRPMILIGAGANRKRASKMLTELVEKTGIPCFSTQMGKGVVDERNPAYLGTAALSDGDFVHCAVEEADLIVNVGHDVVEKPPFIMKSGDKRLVIHVNFYGAKVDEIYFPQLEVIGDVANAVWQLKERLEPQEHWDFAGMKRQRERLLAHLAERAGDTSFPVLPQRFVADVRAVMPDDGLVALDNGMYKLWFARGYEARSPNTLLLDNALATMGAGLPSAIAACLVDPARPVLCVCGDGGFLMNSQEFETAVRLGIRLTVVVLRDDGYGMIKWKQRAAGMEPFGLDFGNPDFVKYAEAYGAKGFRPSSADELRPWLEQCLKLDGVKLIEVPIDYAENDRVFTKELTSVVCR